MKSKKGKSSAFKVARMKMRLVSLVAGLAALGSGNAEMMVKRQDTEKGYEAHVIEQPVCSLDIRTSEEGWRVGFLGSWLTRIDRRLIIFLTATDTSRTRMRRLSRDTASIPR